MKRSVEGGILYETVSPLVHGMGFQIVELVGTQRRGTFHANLVIYREAGVDIGDCTRVYKAVFPRLEVVVDAPEVHLEVSSPGVYRKIKDAREFAVFRGSKVRLMVADSTEWIVGTIVEAGEDAVTLRADGTTQSYRYVEIRKAQLDYP